MQFFKQCLSLESNNFGACMHLATLLASQNEGQRAQKYFMHAIKIDPNSAAANYGLGMVLQEYTQDKEAPIPYYQRVIAQQPNHYKALT